MEKEETCPKKIAILVISLVKESGEKSSKEIEEEILKEIEESRIPWMEKVEKVTVLESDDD